MGNFIPVCVDRPEVPNIAISYTRGDLSTFAELDRGGDKRVEIRTSVYTVLNTLLEKGRILRLWIDAVYINRKD